MVGVNLVNAELVKQGFIALFQDHLIIMRMALPV